MSRSAAPFSSLNPHAGGWFFASAAVLGRDSANLVLTRNAAGDWSLNRVAAGAEPYFIVATLNDLRRIPETEDLQHLFGGTYDPGNQMPLKPPMTAAQMAAQYTAGQTPPKKGIRIDNVVAIYQVGVVGLTAASVALRRTVFANNVAPAVTTLATDATALPLIVQAAPYVAIRNVTVPDFHSEDLSDIALELAITLAATGTVRIYGIGFHISFNFD